MTEDAIREIVYWYGDASVPPQFHRSYRITLTPDKIEIIVDSYGDVLATRTYDTTNEQFEGIVLSLRKNLHQVAEVAEEDDGCTGGTSESVSCSDGAREVFSGTVYHCGAKDSGNLGGDVKRFADAIKRLVPDLEELTKY